jgi:hypothetical protein
LDGSVRENEEVARSQDSYGDGSESGGSKKGTGEDHVWFEDQWMVASWCDE